MPVVGVKKALLFELLEQNFTDKEFFDLCFNFGIELDDVHDEEDGKKLPDNEVVYKIEVPANRYDLLCIEGLVRALRIYREQDTELPTYQAITPDADAMQTLVVHNSVNGIRPVVVCSVLRGVTFTKANYDSFIDLQDKLHQNICRGRTLASAGTHDLDTLQGPFSYQSLPPEEIHFVPLNQTESVDGNGMMTLLEKDLHLRHYLDIIRHNPTYPVIKDANGVVCSVPPIINGEHSKITLKTRNVFIEVTATDRTKALIVLDTLCTMFSQYSDTPFVAERVQIKELGSDNVTLTPDFTNRKVVVPMTYLSEMIGVEIEADKVVPYLRRMSVPATLNQGDASVTVSVPPTRSDILHPCDVAEDVAIAYGFDAIQLLATTPNTITAGKQIPLNHLCDLLREEVAAAGYTELLTLSLCSRAENFGYLNKKEDTSAVVISNPKSQEYQVARTSMLPGLLKSIRENKKEALPLKVFEISDVVLTSDKTDVGAINQRHFCALYSNTSAGFEVVHGLLDLLMELLEIEFQPQTDVKSNKLTYRLQSSEDTTYLPGRCAEVIIKTIREDKDNGSGESELGVGHVGILHPHVIGSFDLIYPVSALVLNIQQIQGIKGH